MPIDQRDTKQFDGSEIAVIGMAGRFPGANTIEEYWDNLCAGRESVSFFTDKELLESGVDPALLKKTEYVKARPIIEHIADFDSTFFGFSPLEANFIDPQHRLFLECVWQAIETAGYNPEEYPGAISVFAGASMNSYLHNNIYANPEAMAAAGSFQGALLNNVSSLTTLIAYKLNLKGACYSVQTFCSTSLVAVHLACQNLLNYECDLAVAGGVSVVVPQQTGYPYEEGLILSPDGHCRPFSDDAQGTLFGNGLGVVVLKRLEDALADGDAIDAIIIGSAVNNDGSLKASYAAPSIEGQKNVIIEALANAAINPETISYVEAHGTGTALGDPTEIAALTKAFRSMTLKNGFCAIGSVKGNIGHLDVAAGVAGLIKTVLALKNRQIPPSINFNQPNPNINFSDSPFFVNSRLTDWNDNQSPRRAGISSFGVGGTNAHMILEEAPRLPPPTLSRRKDTVLLLSAGTPAALEKMQSNLHDFLESNPTTDLSDIAYTLQLGRKAFNHRRMFVCQGMANALSALKPDASAPAAGRYQDKRDQPIVFMFSGQGSQYVNMGRELYTTEKVFQEHVDSCAEILMPHLDMDLRDILYPGFSAENSTAGDINQTRFTQPALFTVEYALAQLLLSWGIRPAALIGHSIGEYVAATLAGVFSLDQALALVATRGRLMDTTPHGAMLTVALPEEKAKSHVNDTIELAVINGPTFCVLSGTSEAIQKLQQDLAGQGIDARQLATSHAFHSKMMDPILVEFASHVNKVAINPPTIPCISNLTGTWINDQDLRAEYWADHLRNTVRFSDGIKNLAAENDYIFLEIGPGNVLSTLTKSHFNAAQMPPVLSAMRHPKDDTSDTAFILKTLGSLWLEGCTIDWNNFYKGEKRSRIPLPTYPFDRKRHWVDPTIPPQGFAAMRAGLITAGTHTQTCQEDSRQIIHEQRSSKPVAPGNDPEQGLVKIWQRVLGHGDIGIHDSFFDIGGNSLNGVRVFTHIYEDFGLRIPLATLFSAPTIELLARVIRQESFDRSWSSLVEIQASGTKPPFFCIHSEGGNIVEYYPLSKHCGTDQPFYGIQARGLSGEQIEGTSVREMARHYLEDIRKKQPSGPYFLGGFCLGGLIAFEMTRQLEAVGEKVAFLGMISTSTPAHVTGIKPGISWAQKNYYSWKERLDYEFSNLSVLGLQEKIRYIRDRFTRLSLHFRYYYESIAEDVSGAFNLGEYKHSRIYNLEQLGKVQHKAFRSYVPHPVIHTPITLIRPSRQPYVRNDDLNLGWEGLSAGGITTYEINCFHKNILKEPHAVQLADILRKCLDDADTR